MKKRIFLLLAVLIMCVGLCACGADLTEERTAAVCGTWYLRAYEERLDNPGYFVLAKDGSGSLNGTEPLTWSVQVDNGDDSGITVSATTDGEDVYTLSLSNNKTEMWLITQEDGPEYCYLRTDTAVSASWFGDLFTRWCAQSEHSAVKTVELKADGLAMLNDAACCWTNGTDWADDGSSIHLYLYNDQGVFGVLEARTLDNGLYEVSIYDYATHRNDSYANHPMVNYLEIGSWESFDRHTMIDDCLILGTESRIAEISGGEYAVKFDTAADPETVTIHFLEGEEIRYTALALMDGQHPMILLTEQASDRQTLYYNSEFGYHEANTDALYYETLDLIYRYAAEDKLYHPESGEEFERQDALTYIYEQLTNLGDYCQAKEFLARFTIVPDKLTGVAQLCTDYQGNVTEVWQSRYGYDSNGMLIWGQGEEIIEKYGVNSYAVQYFTYDPKGRIAEIVTDDGQTQGVPIFDNAGKLVGMHVLGKDTEYTTVYTYGTGHRVIRMGVSKSESYYPLVYEYAYDNEGRLITKTISQGNSFAATSTYTYEDHGLQKIVQVCWRNGSSYTNTHTFTNDEQGRPLSAEVITSDPDMDYAALEIQYIYEDLFFLDTTGLT